MEAGWKGRPGRSKYSNVVVGGTFDRLHAGHRLLISTGLELAEKSLTIGVTDDSRDYLREKILSEMIQPVQIRIESVRDFVSKLDSTVRIEVVPTYEAYEAFVKDPRIECMVTTKEAIDVAEAANGLRKKKSFPPLEVHTIDSLRDENGVPLSSTRLRLEAVNGERQGLYQTPNMLTTCSKDASKSEEVVGRAAPASATDSERVCCKK